MREQKQKERQGYLQQLKERYPLTPGREKILKLNLEALCTKLHSRELKARQVLEAFFAKAVAVTWEYNCVTEFISQSFVRKIAIKIRILHGVLQLEFYNVI